MKQRYRYNGKELNEELGLYDYGARWYDPTIARFTTFDPLADAMVSWSPYNYTFGNPILLSNPCGMVPENITKGPKQFDDIDDGIPMKGGVWEPQPSNIPIPNNQLPQCICGSQSSSPDDTILKGSNRQEAYRVVTAGEDVIIDLPFPVFGGSKTIKPERKLDPNSGSPFAVEIGSSAALLGGPSISIGAIFDGRGNSQGYLNIGGVIGAVGSAAYSIIDITPNPGTIFRISDWAGRATEYFGVLSPVGISHDGNFSPGITLSYKAFTRFGETYTTTGFSPGTRKLGLGAEVKVSNTWLLR